MLKISVIAFTIAASSAASVIQPGALSSADPATGATQAGIAASAPSRAVRQVYYHDPKCRSAERQIATYSRALSRLDMAQDSHRRVAPIYRQARQAERNWHDQNCR
jgi:hypothetical protein